MKLRPPKPLFERLKIPLILAAYIGVSEWADPFPFNVSLPAKLAVFALVLFILREFHHARLEVDEEWAGKTARVERRLAVLAGNVSTRTWLKLQRAAVWFMAFFAFGVVVNSLTDRCDTAVQCGVLAPRLAIENLPTFIQFMVFVSLTLFQLFIMFYAMMKVGSYKLVMPGTVGVSFDDVWGQDDAKQKMLEQVRLLDDSEAVEKAGGFMPRGLLLYGPPGTGKTYLARAAAGYSSKPLILVPPGAFQSTFVGINLLKVAMLFRHVRKLARRYGGVIVFLDEIDSLGSRGGDVSSLERFRAKRAYYQNFVRRDGSPLGVRRSTPSCTSRASGCVRFAPPSNAEAGSEPRRIVVGSAQMGTLEAFLSAMDGMDEPRGMLNRLLVFAGFKPLRPYDYKYLMVGATNMMGRLDPALLRAGRFGRKIHVTYPKVEGRKRTYEGYLARTANELTADDIEWAARNHARGTGAEIKDIVNEALLVSFRDDAHPGRVRFDDLMKAMLWVKFGESDGPFERDEARWNVAVHEAGHAVAFHLLSRDLERIWFASIEQRGEAGGMVAPTALHEDWLRTRDQMLAEVQVSLASRVAEELLLGTTTNGHGGDGQQATATARMMVAYGHASQIGAYDDDRAVRRQTEDVLREALDACRAELEPRKTDVERVAKLLYARGTVPGDEIHRMLEPA